MTKEQLMALGLTAEQAAAVLAGYGETVPKSQLDAKEKELDAANKTIADRDTQLEDLKKVDAAALQTKIADLQEENKKAKMQFDQQLQEERLSAAVKLSLAGKVQDVDIVAGLLDKAKIELDDKGTIKGGLDEQLTTLKESKSFLFVPEKQDKKTPTYRGWSPTGSDEGAGGEVSTGSQFAKEFNEKGSVASANAPKLW